jgi:hypothetical protein
MNGVTLPLFRSAAKYELDGHKTNTKIRIRKYIIKMKLLRMTDAEGHSIYLG